MSNPEVNLNDIKLSLFEIYKNNLRIINPIPEDQNDIIYNKAVERLQELMNKPVQVEAEETVQSESQVPVKMGGKRTTRKHKKKAMYRKN
jgi:hypothetical protein